MKTILLTGASRGIGRETLMQLIQKANFKVLGTSTSGKHPLEHENFRCFTLDLKHMESVKNLLSELEDQKFDYLINNAGVLLDNSTNLKIDLNVLMQTLEVNLFGTIRLTENILPKINSGGHIINVASAWGSFSETNFDALNPHYKISKASLNMYTKLLAKRLEDRNITVSSFDPGWVKTDMGGKDALRLPDDAASELITLLLNNRETGKFWFKGKTRQW